MGLVHAYGGSRRTRVQLQVWWGEPATPDQQSWHVMCALLLLVGALTLACGEETEKGEPWKEGGAAFSAAEWRIENGLRISDSRKLDRWRSRHPQPPESEPESESELHAPAEPAETAHRSKEVLLPFADAPVTIIRGLAPAVRWQAAGFWEFANSVWEYANFRVFNQEIRHGSTYVGLGGGVGVTGLFAMERAATVVLIEPDPEVFTEMEALVLLNADVSVGRVLLDRRCVAKNFPPCVPLPLILQDHGVETDHDMFIKMVFEGAAAVMLPSLLEWILNSTIKPTLFLTMHKAADAAQRTALASLLNSYPFFAIIKGKTNDEVDGSVSGSGVDTGKCKSGVPLARNPVGDRFHAANICNWCNYLVSRDAVRADITCGGAQARADAHAMDEQRAPSRQVPPVKPPQKVWVSLSLCLDETTTFYDKAEVPAHKTRTPTP